MEKEKNEIEPEAVDGIDGECDMKQDDIKLDSESLTMDKTVGCEHVIDTTERKEEDHSKNIPSSVTTAEEAVDEDNSSKDDNKDPAVETRGAAVPSDFELEQKNDNIPLPKKITVGFIKSRSDSAGVTDG
jgi:hypothetical protein